MPDRTKANGVERIRILRIATTWTRHEFLLGGDTGSASRASCASRRRALTNVRCDGGLPSQADR